MGGVSGMKRLLTLALIVTTASSIFSAMASAKKDGEIYIDEYVKGKDRTELTAVMQSLDPEDRENVFYVREDGSFLTNKKELKDEFIKNNSDKLVDGKIKRNDPQAESFSEIGIQSYQNPGQACQVLPDTGPYRRVTHTNGNYRITANIYLPDKDLSEAYMNTERPDSPGTIAEKTARLIV